MGSNLPAPKGTVMKHPRNYELLYRKNEANGNVIIDVLLNNYLEFFHEWDNAAFRKRDIHPELSNFLDLCSEDIPLRKEIEIQFCVKTAEISKDKEDQIRTSYYNYYQSLNRLERRKTKRHLRFSGILLLTALLLLSFYVILNSSIASKTIVMRVLLESLLIGGWVFAWEAIHMLFLDMIDPFRRRRELKRFLKADIGFRYL